MSVCGLWLFHDASSPFPGFVFAIVEDTPAALVY